MRKREAEDRARQEEERRQQEEERTRREAEEKVVIFRVPQGFLQAFPLQPAQYHSVLGQQGLNTVAPVIGIMAQGFSLSIQTKKELKETAHSCWLELTGIAEIVLQA